MATAVHPQYPLTVEGTLDEHLSRWLWLVKWFLAIPHYILLAFLWVAYVLMSIVAFFAILFTGRYPRGIFEFNVGVLRWSWRVSYYAYGALATDKYPPFTLSDVPDYPTHLEIAYPERLSRGLVLVKWWLLAIPHYIIVGLFVGGVWAGFHIAGGLIGLLAIFAAIMLAITAEYPKPLYDLILGLNRWALRVAAYAGLMTDQYPPFRLDLGGSESGGTLTLPTGGMPPASGTVAPAPARARRWGVGRILAVVFGSILVLPSLGAMAGGGALLWADLTQRDAHRYISTSTETFTTSTYAITSDRIELPGEPTWAPIASALGTVRVRVTPVDPAANLFVGIARTSDLEGYMGGVGHAVTSNFSDRGIARTIQGPSPVSGPGTQSFWVAKSSGVGARTVSWKAESGKWSIVAMNADGKPGVAIRANLGATVPALRWVAIGLLAGGGFFLLVGMGLVIGAAVRRT